MIQPGENHSNSRKHLKYSNPYNFCILNVFMIMSDSIPVDEIDMDSLYG